VNFGNYFCTHSTIRFKFCSYSYTKFKLYYHIIALSSHFAQSTILKEGVATSTTREEIIIFRLTRFYKQFFHEVFFSPSRHITSILFYVLIFIILLHFLSMTRFEFGDQFLDQFCLNFSFVSSNIYTKQ
jgi:hypothetical protein